MKIIFFFALAVFLFRPVIANASALPASVRVGLTSSYNNVSEIKIANSAISFGYANMEAAVIYGGFSAVPTDMYYLKTDELFSDYDRARQSAEAYAASGHKACVGFIDSGTYAVYFGGYKTEADALSANAAIGKQTAVLAPDRRRTALIENSSPVIIFDNLNKHGMISGAGGEFIRLGANFYRGAIELNRNNSNGITAVNVLGTEEYLCGAVASEMLLGNAEAVKAHAVAARSYFATQRGVHGTVFDVCDSVHCQNYIGAVKETESSNRAVRETSGLMAYYGGEIINATYFSSSGGVTANSEDVWSNTIPYLRSVPDPYEKTAKVWERSFTLSEITVLLQKNGALIGNATGVTIGADASGRVARLTINGTNGSHALEKENIRLFFAPSAGGILESRNFTARVFGGNESGPVNNEIFAIGANIFGALNVSGMHVLRPDGNIEIAGNFGAEIHAAGVDGIKIINAAASVSSFGETIVFSGKGYGHGVGLSQHGAFAMAEAGFNFREILMHYYTGIEIR